jgi:hypothetical protein
MAGFKAGGGVSFGEGGDSSVVFLLKSSSGQDLKTFLVPLEKADEFEAEVHSDELNLRESLGESEPLRLIKVSRCF